MFRDMQQWSEIRRRVLTEGVSRRQIQRETGLHLTTINKILTHSSPPEFCCPARPKPKLGGFKGRISTILDAEKRDNLPSKQRHTAMWIFERLREEGYTGGYTQVREAVRELRRSSQAVIQRPINKCGSRGGETLVWSSMCPFIARSIE